MKQVGPWSRRSSNDTMTSDTLTNFLNMSTSSPRSSSTSLPFAEDAVRQNQEEWEHIERIFYGEEPLPEDEKTREEFQDWMDTFYYLRVVGRRVNTERFRTNRNVIYHEEVIAKDPPDARNTENRSSKLVVVGGSKSGQILSRRFDCDGGEIRTLPVINSYTVAQPKGKDVQTARPGGLASNSANIFRLPGIELTSSNSNKWSTTSYSDPVQATSRPMPLKSTLTLPSLNVDKLTFGDLLTTRSISALHSQPTGDEQRIRKRHGNRGSNIQERYK